MLVPSGSSMAAAATGAAGASCAALREEDACDREPCGAFEAAWLVGVPAGAFESGAGDAVLGCAVVDCVSPGCVFDLKFVGRPQSLKRL